MPTAAPSEFVEQASSNEGEDDATAGMSVLWALVALAALAIIGCLVFAALRFRHMEKAKALEMDQWSSRNAGVSNPMYAVPDGNGGLVRVLSDPYRKSGVPGETSTDAGLYGGVTPLEEEVSTEDTYGGADAVIGGYLNVESIDDAAVRGRWLKGCDGTQANPGPPVPRASENAIYDLSFQIPTAEGTTVVAYQDSDTVGGADAEYMVVGGADVAVYDGDTYMPMAAAGPAVKAGGDPHLNTDAKLGHAAASEEVVLTDTYDSITSSVAVGEGILTTSFRKSASTAAAAAQASLCMHASLTTGTGCNLKPAAASQYCINHTCTLGDCARNKPSGQSFCDQHSIGSIDLYGRQAAPTADNPAAADPGGASMVEYDVVETTPRGAVSGSLPASAADYAGAVPTYAGAGPSYGDARMVNGAQQYGVPDAMGVELNADGAYTGTTDM